MNAVIPAIAGIRAVGNDRRLAGLRADGQKGLQETYIAQSGKRGSLLLAAAPTERGEEYFENRSGGGRTVHRPGRAQR